LLIQTLVIRLDPFRGVDQAVLGREDLDLEASRPSPFKQSLSKYAVIDPVIEVEGWYGRLGVDLSLGACEDK
jgi:hypothetical protein